MNGNNEIRDNLLPKCLIVVYSYHHNNTAKIAERFSQVLKADIKSPLDISYEELLPYEVIGFGAGIDSGKHYKPLLDFVENLPLAEQKSAFIFSTSAIQGVKKVDRDHALLRQTILAKGYVIIGEFSCKGYNTNSFLKYFGGMNKGRPNSEDFEHAEEFALRLIAGR